MALLTPQQFLEKMEQDKAAQQKARLDYGTLVEQYNALVSSIITELSQAESKMDTLRKFDGIIEAQGKETSHRINAMLGFTIAGNVATTKAWIEHARQSFRSKG